MSEKFSSRTKNPKQTKRLVIRNYKKGKFLETNKKVTYLETIKRYITFKKVNY